MDYTGIKLQKKKSLISTDQKWCCIHVSRIEYYSQGMKYIN